MPLDSDQILIAGTGRVYVAPLNTAEPAGPESALNAAFVDLGFTSEDGVREVDEKTMLEVRSWQSFYVTRRKVQTRNHLVSFQMQQWNGDNVKFAFGGGSLDAVTGGVKYTPPDPEEVDERALIVDAVDGDKHHRLVIPRGMVVENVETNYTRQGPSLLPITFAITTDGDDDPWYFLTDDPAFEADGS